MPKKTPLPILRFSDWKNLDAHLVWIYEGRPQVPAGSSNTEYYTAWMIECGSVEVSMRGVKVRAARGDWVLLPPGSSERVFSSQARILSLHFEARWVTGRQLVTLDGPMVFGIGETGRWRVPARPMLELVRQHFPGVYTRLPAARVDFALHGELQGCFQSWLACLWSGLAGRGVEAYLPDLKDPRVLEIKRRLDAHPLQRPFRLEQLAEVSRLSGGQINRLFCAEFGITPRRYYEQRRLSYAKASLATSSGPVKEISYATGFRHLAEFSAWFKKHSGKCPRHFRKAALAVARVDDGGQDRDG